MAYVLPGAVLTAAGLGSATSSPIFVQPNTIGVHAIINISVITGTAPTLAVSIQAFDVLSNTWYTLLSSSALNAAGQTILRIFPGSAVTANLSANDFIPEQIRLSWTIAGTGPAVTATIGLNFV